MRKIRRLSALILSGILLFFATSCTISVETEGERFQKFLENEFITAMESDYVTSHVYLQEPENYNIDESKIEVRLGARFDDTSLKESGNAVETAYKTFQKFTREFLTEEQKDLYDLYEYQQSLAVKLNDEKFSYYTPLFQSMTGLHYQLPTLLADWEVRNEQDVQDLILLVKDSKPYIDSALAYTKKQQEKGLLMLDLQSIIDYCDSILEKGENSSILTSMYTNIDTLGLSEEKTESYRKQLKEAFQTSFIPAYQAIRDTMENLQSGQNNQFGLEKFENGKEYYELLLQQSIGSHKSVEEIREMMTQAYNNHLINLTDVMLSSPEDIQPLITGQLPETGYNSYEEILNDIQDKMLQDFPKVSHLEYNIMDINEEIASSSGIAAYFNIPALDGTSPKQLRVNPLTGEISSITTFFTVSHEGFPGHMYQYAYMYENTDSNYAKAMSNVSAYTEGYAVYAQYSSAQYLEGINENLLTAYIENELATYAVIILADIGIHYDGWSLQEFTDFLTQKGFILDEENAEIQYRQLQANPAAFQSYYVGYEEIAAMKESAMKELGENFSEKGFNEALLKSGAAPFNVVEKNITAYIKESSSTFGKKVA